MTRSSTKPTGLFSAMRSGVFGVAGVLACLLLLAACSGETEVHPLPSYRASAIPSFAKVWPAPSWRALAVAPDENRVMAIGADGELARSTDNGSHWQVAGKAATNIEYTAMTAKANGELAAVGLDGAVVRSFDAGISWSDPQRITLHGLHDIVATPLGTLVAVGEEGIIVRNEPGSSTWEVVAKGLTGETLGSVIVNPQNGSLVAVGSSGTIVRSLDSEGKSWKLADSVQLPRNLLPKPWLACLIAVPKRPGTLVAVGEDGVIVRSTDSGQNWFTADSHSNKLLQSALALPGGDLLASGEEQTVLRSDDGGQSWNPVTSDRTSAGTHKMIGGPGNAVLALSQNGDVVRSGDEGATWSVVARGATELTLKGAAGQSRPGGTFVAVGQGGTILRSTDRGRSWANVAGSGTNYSLQSVIAEPTRGGFVAVGEGGAIVRLNDDGTLSPKPPNRPTPASLLGVIAVPGKQILVAVGDHGAIARSIDGGFGWSLQPRPATTQPLAKVVAQAGISGVLVAVGQGGAIVRSVDGGITWKLAADSGTEDRLTGVVASNKGTLVAVGARGTIVRSRDSGENWSRVASSGKWPGLLRVSADPSGNLLAPGDDGSVILSIDDGINWSQASLDKDGASLLGIAAESGGALIGVGSGGAVRRSNDGGASWSPLAGSGTTKPLNAVIAVPDGTVLAAGNAIIRSTGSAAVEPVIHRITQSYAALSSHPVLRVALADPANLCAAGACLSIEVSRSGPQVAPDKFGFAPSTGVTVKPAAERGNYEISIDPESFGVQRPHPVFVRLRTAGQGFSRIYPASGTSFEIANNPAPWYRSKWGLTILGALALTALFYVMLLSRPLLLLGFVTQPAILDAAGELVSAVGKTVVGVLRVVLLPILARHPRVLDAWIEKHGAAILDEFELSTQVAANPDMPYMSLPVDGPDNELVAPEPQSVKRYFQSQCVLIQIIGPGGAGKTRLAIEIGRWLFAGQVLDHPVAVLFIDEEFNDLLAVVQAKLRASLKVPLPPAEFVSALLAKGRVCVIVDRVSERQPPTRDAVATVYRTVTPKVLICTARYPIDTEGARPVRLRPRPLDPTTLLAFLGELLKASNASDLFPRLADQARLVESLSRQITLGNQELAITPLLVRVFVAQAIILARARGVMALRDLPGSVPEAYFAYIEQLDAAKHTAGTESAEVRELIRRAAVLIAFVELGDDFRPKPVPVAQVEQALRSDARLAGSSINFPGRLEDNGLLVRHISGAEATVEFILDPLAECMAAFEHARLAGPAPGHWQLLIDKISARGQDAKGLMLALQMIHSAYGTALGFPVVTFPDAPAGLTAV